MFDFSKTPNGGEKDVITHHYARSYGVAASAVTIDRTVVTGAQVKLYLTIRLGSSPTAGTETYTRLDLAALFAGLDEIAIGAGGQPAFNEFRAYFQKQFNTPTDHLEITRFGNAYVVSARTDSLLFVGKKTFYVR